MNTVWLILILSGFICSSSAFGEESQTRVEQARQLHLDGIEFYSQGNYSEAVERFQAAHELAPAPANLVNLARCYERLGNIEAAVEAIEAYLESPQLTPERQERGQRFRARLVTTPGIVEIHTRPEGAEVFVNSLPASTDESTPTRVRLEPGTHVIQVRLAGYGTAQQSVDVAPGSEQVVTFEIVPSDVENEEQHQSDVQNPDLSSDSQQAGTAQRFRAPRGAWILLSTGLIVGTGATILGVITYSLSEEDDKTFENMDAYKRWQEQVENLALATDVVWPIAAVALTAAVVWFVIELMAFLRNRQNVNDQQAYRFSSGGRF